MVTNELRSVTGLGQQLEEICLKAQGASSIALERLRKRLDALGPPSEKLNLLLTELALAYAEEPVETKKNTRQPRDIQIQAVMELLRIHFAIKFDEAGSLLTGGRGENRFAWHTPKTYVGVAAEAA